ncbi:hypothetical protein ACF0H5_022736 [Mactra antiquata]
MSLLNDLPEEDFIHWVKATLGLQLAKRASSNYIRMIMTGFIAELKQIHGTDEEAHFDTLLYKVLFRGEVKRAKVKGVQSWILYDQSCPHCKSVFDSMSAEFNDSKYCKTWKRHDTAETFTSDQYWWIVSKLYISNKCEVAHATGPEEVDPFAVLSLIQNCKRFHQQVKDQMRWMIKLRHELMHSSTNTLTKKKMEENFEMIKTYLDAIKQCISNMSREVFNDLDKAVEDLDKALTDLDDLKKKELGIFDRENNLHDYTRQAIQTLQQCLRTDFKIPAESDFDIITKLITRIERMKCEKEKQQLRDQLKRSEEEKIKSKADDLAETTPKTLYTREGNKQSATSIAPVKLETVTDPEIAPVKLETVTDPKIEPVKLETVTDPEIAPVKLEIATDPEKREVEWKLKYEEELKKTGDVRAELEHTAKKLKLFKEEIGIVFPEHRINPFSDAEFLKEIDVIVDSDGDSGVISDMCQMHDGTILILDIGNRRLKRLDDQYKVMDFYECKYKPVHVVTVSSSEVAILTESSTLQYVCVNGHEPMICNKEVRLERSDNKIVGMVYCNNQIWICDIHEGICIYDLLGSLMKKIPRDSRAGRYDSNIMSTNNEKTRVYVINDYFVETFDKYGKLLFPFTITRNHCFCITLTNEDLLLISDLFSMSIEMYDMLGRRLGKLDTRKCLLYVSTSTLFDGKNCCLIVSHDKGKCSLFQLKR